MFHGWAVMSRLGVFLILYYHTEMVAVREEGKLLVSFQENLKMAQFVINASTLHAALRWSAAWPVWRWSVETQTNAVNQVKLLFVSAAYLQCFLITWLRLLSGVDRSSVMPEQWCHCCCHSCLVLIFFLFCNTVYWEMLIQLSYIVVWKSEHLSSQCIGFVLHRNTECIVFSVLTTMIIDSNTQQRIPHGKLISRK